VFVTVNLTPFSTCSAVTVGFNGLIVLIVKLNTASLDAISSVFLTDNLTM